MSSLALRRLLPWRPAARALPRPAPMTARRTDPRAYRHTYVVLAPDPAAPDPWGAVRALGTVAADNLAAARTFPGARWARRARARGCPLRVWRASACRRGLLIEALAADGARLLGQPLRH